MPGHRVSVRSNGLALATQVDGDAGRPWIVLLNSIGSTLRCWDGQVPLLARSHRVLRYDARGHGESEAPGSGTAATFADLAADVLGLMDHYGIEKADLLGLSMGGMTALGLAIDHPGRVRRVICCDARADAPPPFVASWDARIAAIRDGGMEAIVDGTLERWFTPGFSDRDPAIVAAAAMIRATAPTGYIACAEALKGLDLLPRLGEIGAPTLFLCGAQDQASPPAVMRDMAARVPDATYREIDPGAHLCNLENPVAFEAEVEAWLAATESRSA